jgi:hypothetical protein
MMYKDEILDQLSEVANVAQFVSFSPSGTQRYCRVRGYAPNHRFGSLEAAVSALLEAAPDNSVNVRSFEPENPKSREFIYGLQQTADVVAAVRRLGSQGLHTIVNETIDVHDGGVSGVALGDVLEFAPGDTPRCVEKPGTASLPRHLGIRLLTTVYRFRPALDYAADHRVEFSIHPLPRGFLNDHTIVWELEPSGLYSLSGSIHWPNLFSRHLGDKAFGLLVAHVLDLPVPLTTVICRSVAPFTFGENTGSGELWIRTCPTEQVPGKFTTQRGWLDPFKLMAEEDGDGSRIASVLAQEGVDAQYSGGLVTGEDGSLIIEGVRGRGDEFMQGSAPESLPEDVLRSVRQVYRRAAAHLGAVRFEWVHDGRKTWIVQLHRGAAASSGGVIYPGQADVYQYFEVSRGLEALRSLIAQVQGSGQGIVLVGRVGVTSHFGDVLRKAQIPSRIEADGQ